VNRGAPGWLPITWLNNASGGTVMRWRVDSLARLIALSLACGCAAQGGRAADPAIADEAGSIRFVR